MIKVHRGAQDQPRKGVQAFGRRLNPLCTILIYNGGGRGNDMDISAIIEFVQQVGFPIACTVALFYLLYQEMKQRQQDSEERAKRDSEFVRVIAENTAATNSLKDYVKSIHGGDHN